MQHCKITKKKRNAECKAKIIVKIGIKEYNQREAKRKRDSYVPITKRTKAQQEHQCRLWHDATNSGRQRKAIEPAEKPASAVQKGKLAVKKPKPLAGK